MKTYRDCTIEVVLNGFLVTIGCAKVVAETPRSLLKLIADYLGDPEKTEKELNEKSMKYLAFSNGNITGFRYQTVGVPEGTFGKVKKGGEQ